MSSNIPINQIEIETPCSEVEIIIPYILNASSLVCWVHYKSEENTTIKYEKVVISPEEYAQWTTDDTYMEDLILSKVNLSKKSVPDPIPEPVPEPQLEPVPETKEE